MAANRNEGLVIAGLFVAFIAFLVYCQSDGLTLAQVSVKCLFGLGVITFIIHCLGSWLQRAISSPKGGPDVQHTEAEVRSKQQQARKKIQDDYDAKAADYNDKILKPREEAERKKREQDFYRLAGPAWKGEGHKLGHADDDKVDRTQTSSAVKRTSRDAAEARKLPEHVVNPARPPVIQQPVERKKIKLPEEPEEGSTGSITIVLRTPQGRTLKRRFLVTETIQVLLDYMTTVGYHQLYYTLSTSYPRQSLADSALLSLESLSFTNDVALNVEEKGDE